MSDSDSEPNVTQTQPPDLSEFDADYAATTPLSTGEVPDGRYQVKIGGVQLGHTRKGDAMLAYDLVVLAGEHAHRHVFKNAVITDRSLPLVKGELEMLELDLETFSQLHDRLDEVLGRALEVTKRTSDGYTNVYFNKRIPALDEAPF